MFLGREQRYNPSYSPLEKAYIALFGMPIVGLRIRARNIFSLIPADRNYKRLLDAGSGPGVISFEMGRQFPKANVQGVDFDGDAVMISNHIAKKIGATNVKFRKSAIEDLNEKDSFDLIVCVDILEHIENDLKAIEALLRLITPGGILVLHIPYLYRLYPVWSKALNFDVPTHVRRGYEPEEIQEKVRQAGFIIMDSGFTYGFWETLANNLSYMITRARKQNKILYSFAFPFLYLISYIGPRARPKDLGAGIFLVAEKRKA
jgi:2-polyprenyl-3-methyl-5-hydroxy-6-metoxy-1,4-benzoquinol methylase